MTRVRLRSKDGLDKMLYGCRNLTGTLLWLRDDDGTWVRIDRDPVGDRWLVKRDNCWSARTSWTRESLLERLFNALPNVWYNTSQL